MARFKDFGEGVKANKEPLVFKLWGEEFQCSPVIQGKVLLEIVSDSSSEDAAKSAKVIEKFFSTVLDAESKKKFDVLLSDPERITTIETLGEIVAWLMEEYAERPKEQPVA